MLIYNSNRNKFRMISRKACKYFTLICNATGRFFSNGRATGMIGWNPGGVIPQEAWGLISVENWGFSLLSSENRYGMIVLIGY